MNGGPIFFSDTTSYVRAADAVAYRATGHATIWSDVISSAEKGAAARAGAASGAGAGLAVPGASVEQQSSSFEKNIILGRSIFYGGLLYCGVLLGGLALSAGVQRASRYGSGHWYWRRWQLRQGRPACLILPAF
ncbi:MAG: hypothetical protein DI607_12275 [Sphingomonas hengshuiensis]|nr:MAG: hypothetical protein DI607_12275 [Sphingomonas hengshuiensis]